jgi:hypothetical protein
MMINEAVITFVCTDLDNTTYTKVARVEFEGSPEAFLAVLNDANGTLHKGWPEAFNVVAAETLSAS